MTGVATATDPAINSLRESHGHPIGEHGCDFLQRKFTVAPRSERDMVRRPMLLGLHVGEAETFPLAPR